MLLRKLARGASRQRLLAPKVLQRRSVSGLAIPGTPRALRDVAKIDLLQQEEPSRIGAIWEAFHSEGTTVAGDTVGPEEAEEIFKRGGESPTFIFPIRREGGHFMLFSQYAAAHRMFVFTYLEDYRRNPELAQPWASVHLFDELVTTKGVGLLRAEVVPERLTKAEASHLLLLIRRYCKRSPDPMLPASAIPASPLTLPLLRLLRWHYQL